MWNALNNNMINPNNLNDLSSSLEEIIDTPVSTQILEKLTPKQRSYLTVLIYQWTQGKEVVDTIKSILDQGKKYIPKYIPYRDRPTKKIF